MNSSKIKVSVIIVAFNCKEVIKQCIESLQHQNDTEIIVIDNNSSDGTIEIIRSILFDFIFIENKTNTGFTFACNQGIKIARGKYVFLLNPDAYITPCAISILLPKIESQPTIGAVVPQLLYPDGKVQNYNRRFPKISGVLIESFVPTKFWNKFASYRSYVYEDIDLAISQDLEQPAGAAILFRNEFLLDERYFIYGSDVELCKNILDKGYRIVLIPEATVYHHQSKGGTGSSNVTVKAKLQLDYYYAMRYFFKKHYGYLYSICYTALNVIFLTLIAFVSVFSFNRNHVKLKFVRLFSFLMNKNFSTANI